MFRYDFQLVNGSEAGLEVFDRFNSNPGPVHVLLNKRGEEH
jgi:hypothetical protein